MIAGEDVRFRAQQTRPHGRPAQGTTIQVADGRWRVLVGQVR